jgi:energy-coupling factor transport system substrate-specific component
LIQARREEADERRKRIMANTSPAEEGTRGSFFSRIAADFSTRAWVLIPIGVGMNIVGGSLVTLLKLPVFLDVIGTILVAILAGPWVAALNGLVTNLILGVTASPTLVPYAIVNVAIGLVAGYLGLRGWFRSYWKIFIAGLIITVTAIVVGAPITAFVFGGVTGSGISLLNAYFLATGSTILESVLKADAIVEPIDKIISVFVAFFIARAIPARYRPQKARQILPD